MLKSKLSDVLEKIDSLHQLHISTRGILQYVGSNRIGETELLWGARVKKEWIDLHYNFQNPINETTRASLNRLSEFMNQNFIVRLHSLLEYEGVKTKKVQIDKSLKGHDMIEIIHFLRIQYAHRHGDFDPSDKASVELRDRLFATFKIDPADSLPTQFPLDKNKVIQPIVEGTKEYVREFYAKQKKTSPNIT
jgi:hypothetical protein